MGRYDLVLCVVASAMFPAMVNGQVFTYQEDSGAVYSAEISSSRVTLKEVDSQKNLGREGQLSCPAGADVRATPGKKAGGQHGAGAVCVSFQDAGCTMRRIDGTGKDIRAAYGYSSFCINMGTADQARQVADLINQQRSSAEGKRSERVPSEIVGPVESSQVAGKQTHTNAAARNEPPPGKGGIAERDKQLQSKRKPPKRVAGRRLATHRVAGHRHHSRAYEVQTPSRGGPID